MIRLFNQYVSLKSPLIILLEGVLILLALVAAVKLRFWNDLEEFQFYTAWPGFGARALVVVLIFQISFYYHDLYAVIAPVPRREQLVRLGQSLGASSLVLGFLYFLFPSLLLGRGVFFIMMFLVIVAVTVARIAVDRAWQATGPSPKVLILGVGELAQSVARELTRRKDLQLRVIGLVAEEASQFTPGQMLFGYPVLGTAGQLEAIANQCGASRIIVAMQERRGTLPIRDLVTLRVKGWEVEEAQSTLAALTGRVALNMVQPSWLVFSDGFRRSKFTMFLKRIMDLLLSFVGLVVTSPLMALVAIGIKLDSPGPILYRQERVGWKDRRFSVLKFRSMREGAESVSGAQWSQEGDPRITRLGQYLRRFRLDELPQFLNIVAGDMSFVGPRPERPFFVEQLRERIPYYDERHAVRPGLTGWAQTQYRYGASIDDSAHKLEYDLFYMKNMSIPFDCAIIFRTVQIVLNGRGGR